MKTAHKNEEHNVHDFEKALVCFVLSVTKCDFGSRKTVYIQATFFCWFFELHLLFFKTNSMDNNFAPVQETRE